MEQILILYIVLSLELIAMITMFVILHKKIKNFKKDATEKMQTLYQNQTNLNNILNKVQGYLKNQGNDIRTSLTLLQSMSAYTKENKTVLEQTFRRTNEALERAKKRSEEIARELQKRKERRQASRIEREVNGKSQTESWGQHT